MFTNVNATSVQEHSFIQMLMLLCAGCVNRQMFGNTIAVSTL